MRDQEGLGLREKTQAAGSDSTGHPRRGGHAMRTPPQTTTTTRSTLKVKTHVKAGSIIVDDMQKQWLPAN
jgi:hypothetical protein